MSRTTTKQVKKYQVRSGGRINPSKIQEYGQFIQSLLDSNGGKLTAGELLRHAKKKTCPIHDWFDWENSVAADKWRLHQARLLLTQVAEVKIIDDREVAQRSFFAVSDEESESGFAYVSIDTALTDRDYTQELLDKLLDRLDGARDTIRLLKQNL